VVLTFAPEGNLDMSPGSCGTLSATPLSLHPTCVSDPHMWVVCPPCLSASLASCTSVALCFHRNALSY
jgi:hypothetical protein